MFRDIVGHSGVVSYLRGLFQKGRLQGSYLFVGPEGVGKTCVAVNLAKMINCEKATDDSCEECFSCRQINSASHPDIFLAQSMASGAVGISEIRRLKDHIHLKPYQARYKVYIIPACQKLSEEAGNALLKTLEEPPSDTLLVLLTDVVSSVLPTVLSRCQKLYFSPLPPSVLAGWLQDSLGLGREVSHWLAHFSRGRLGYAFRLNETGMVGHLREALSLFFERRPRLPEEFFNFKNKGSTREELTLLVQWLSDALFLKYGRKEEEITHCFQRDHLSSLASRKKDTELLKLIMNLADYAKVLEYNLSPKLLRSNFEIQIWKELFN